MTKRMISLMLAIVLLLSCVFVGAENEGDTANGQELTVQEIIADSNDAQSADSAADAQASEAVNEPVTEAAAANDSEAVSAPEASGDTTDIANASEPASEAQQESAQTEEAPQDEAAPDAETETPDESTTELATQPQQETPAEGTADAQTTEETSVNETFSESAPIEENKEAQDVTDVPNDEATEEAAAGEAEIKEVSEETEAEDVIDYDRNCAYSPAFTEGYVELREGAKLYAKYADEDAFATVKKGVAYATSRLGAGGSRDRLVIVYADAEGEYTAFVDADDATPLSAIAIERFMVKVPQGNTHFANKEKTLPLIELEVSLLEAAQPDTEETGAADADPAAEIPGDANPEQDNTSEDGGADAENAQTPATDEPSADTTEVEQPAPTQEAQDPAQQDGDAGEGETQPATDPATVNEEPTEGETENTETAEPTQDENTDPTIDEAGEVTESAQVDPTQDAETETAPTDEGTEAQQPVDTEVQDETATEAPEGSEGNPEAENPETEEGTTEETTEDPATEETETEATEITDTELEPPVMLMSMRMMAAAPSVSADIVFDDFGDKVGLGDAITVSAYTVDENGTRTADSVSFSIEGDCAEISGDTITGKALGSFVLTAISEQGIVKTMDMRVTSAPSSLSLDKTSLTVGVNGTAMLTYSVNEDSAGSAVWTSSDESIARVSKNGMVTGVSSGTAVITVISYNGLTDYCAVSVMSEPDDLKLSVSSIVINENETVEVDAAFTGDVFGNVYCEELTGDAQVNLKSLGGGSFEITGVYSGEASALFYVYNKTTDQTYFARLNITVKPAVTRIEFQNVRSEIGLKETVDLKPVAYDARGNVMSEEIELTTSNKGCVAIKEQAIFGQYYGTATVTAITANGTSASLKIKTVKAPTSITLSAKTAEMSVGEALTLDYTLSAGSASAITWTSSNPAVASVDDEGNVKAVGAGSARITAATFVKNKFAYCDVTISAAPEAVSFDKSEYDVLEGMTLSTALVFTPANAAGAVSYSVADRLIASVNENGVVTGLNTGSTTVTVVAHSALTGENFTASATVNVKPAPASIVLGTERRTIGKGEVLELDPKSFEKYGEAVSTTFTLTSNKPKVVVVQGTAIRGVANGTADITISAQNGYSIKITVKVLSAPTKLTISKTSLQLAAGQSAEIDYKLAPASTATAIAWTSDNEEVATVVDGVVVAHKPGTAKITCATYLENVHGECTVTVYAAPTAIRFGADAIEIGEGAELVPAVTLEPSGAAGEISYELSFPNEEATAALDGKTLKGLYSGTAYLTAKVYNYETESFVTGTVTVNILPAVSSIAFRSDRNSIGLKETVDLKPVAYDARGNEIEAEIKLSIKGGYVKLVEGTTVYGNSRGTSTITATAANGVKEDKKYQVIAAPAKVTITAPQTQVVIGESMSLKAVTTGSDAADVTWMSSDETVFTVNNSGAVTAVGLGNATITATTYNDKKAEIELSAVHAPEGIRFLSESYTVSEGGTVQTQLVTQPEGGVVNAVYSISDGDGEYVIATVDAKTGLITGVASGSAVVTATVTDHENGTTLTATATVTVTTAPSTIEITGRTTVGVGEVVDLKPVAYDGRGNVIDTTFTLTSSAAGTVKANGGTTVRGQKRGNANITVKAANGASTTVKVVVNNAPSVVKLNETKLSLQSGDTFTVEHSFNAGQTGAVSYASSDTDVATVNEDGVITALAAGTATVTVKSYNNKSAKLTLTVSASPTAISLNRTEIKLVPGATEQLSTLLTLAGSWAKLSYTTSDESVASVDESGKLSAKKLGSAVITVSAYSNVLAQTISAQLNVEVCKFPVEVRVNETELILGVGETAEISAAAYNEQGEAVETEFTLETSDKRFVTVKDDTVKGVKYGSANITVTAPGGSKSVIKVTVMNAPGAVKLDKTASLAVGETVKFEPTFNAKQYGSVTWTVDDETVATVDAQGNVTALKQGSAKLTVKTYNNKKATCTLHVYAAPTAISFENASYTVSEDETIATVLKLEPAGSFAHPVYTVAYDGEAVVAQVDASGKITGVTAGTATLTATVYNAEKDMTLSASCEIKVVPAAVTIRFEQERTKIGVGETIDLKPVAYDRSGNKVETTFTLKSSSIYQLAVKGTTVRGVKVSKPSVTVTSANGTSVKVEITVVAAPSKIDLSARTNKIPLGGSIKLSASVNNVPEAPLSWTSSDPSVATVTASGTVTAKSLGEVTITAVTYNNKKDTIKLNVVPEANSLSFEQSEEKVGLGATQLIEALLPEGTAANVIYASSNPFVARVNAQTGEVTGIRVGTARIIATIKNVSTGKYFSASYTVTVTPVPASIGFGTDRRVIGVNEKLALEAQAYDASGAETGSTFTYKSSNVNVVSVNDEGILTAKRGGTVTITVTSYNGVKQTVSIRVVAAPTAINFKDTAASVVIGYTDYTPAYTLNPNAAVGEVSFASEDESIATVDTNGRIRGVSAGTVVVRAQTYNNKKDTINVTVYNAPGAVHLSAEELSLGEGQSATLGYTFDANEFSAITFASDNEAVAKVDASGKIGALKAGTAKITATAVNGVSGTCHVTVKSAPASVSFAQNSLVIGVGQIFDANDYVELPEGTQASLTFKPESSYVLDHKGEGVIRGKALGTTRVRVTTHNGKTALMTVKVVKAATNFKVNLSQEVIYEGASFTLEPEFPNNTTALVTFESDNADVITVDAEGAAKALSAGKATVTATAHNGAKVKTEITVYRHVESVAFEQTALSIVHYDAQKLNVLIAPEGVYDNSLTWTSSDEEKVSVASDGTITALNITASPVTITATSNDTGVSASCQVNVTPVRLSDMTLSAQTLTLERGRSANVTVSFSPENADDKSVTWQSSNPSVATVDSEGTVTAIASSGTAVISCTSNDGGIVRTVNVTAEKVHLVSAELATNEITLQHYEEADIAYTVEPADADIADVTWTISNPAVLYVSQEGHMKALAVGKATVTLELTDAFGDKLTRSLNVTVIPVKVTAVSLGASEIHLRIGRSQTLAVSVLPDNADNKAVSWNVSDKNLISLTTDETGAVITAGTKAGETTLTVTTQDGGFTAECLVKVFEPLAAGVTPNFTHNTVGNDIVWKIAPMNALGEVSYAITVSKDGAVINSLTSYDSEKGVVVSSAQKGEYKIAVTLRDSEGDVASAESTVSVDNTFTLTENSIVWEYTIVDAQGDAGAAVKLVSCPAGTTSVTVPKTFDGAKVVRIETEAFLNMSSLKTVRIPDTVTEIGARAFKGCTALSEFTSY